MLDYRCWFVYWLKQQIVFCLACAISFYCLAAMNAFAQQAAPPVGASAAPAASASVTFFVNTQQYEFINPTLDPPPDFRIKLSEPRVMMGLVSIQSFVRTMRAIPVYQGGFWVQNATGQVFSPLQIAGLGHCKLLRQALEGKRLVLEYEETVFGAVLKKRFEFRLVGRTLEVVMTDTGGPQDQARYIGFSFGPTRYVGRPKYVAFPTSPLPALQSLSRFYLSQYVDPFRSNLNRYTYSLRRENSRSFHASNTPAWVEPNDGEEAPPLRVVGYVTLSEDPLDIAPTRPVSASPDASDLRTRIAFDWSETPFVPLRQGYVTQTRRWVAPTSGPIELNGNIRLSSSGRALFEVVLDKPGEPQRLLFSQMIDSQSKPATAMKGSFPISQGDQLRFSVQSPAVMQGGAVDLRIQIQQGSAQYDSMNDFASVQGHKGWYYEQDHKQGGSLLLWNPTTQVWESPDTRSMQSALTTAVRSGPKGDAFPTAAAFLSRLQDFGVPTPMYILRDWDKYAVETIHLHTNDQAKWGANSVLASIDSALANTQTRVEYQWPLEPLDNFGSLSQLMITDVNEGSDLAAFLVSDVVEEAAPETPTARLIAPPSVLTATPDLVPPADQRFTRALYRFVKNKSNPALLPTELSLLVDDALRNQRPAQPVVGFGGYSAFLGEEQGAAWQDDRFFPFDEYLTSTIVFGRVPHLSDRLWNPESGPEGVLRHLVEAAMLLQPVMNEVLDPLNAVLQISYLNEEGQQHELQELMVMREYSEVAKFNRLRIEFANGMTVFANRSDMPWSIDEPGLGIDAIAPGGFWARNERTGVVSLIGQRGERVFSLSVSPGVYFIHSRNGSLVRVGEFAGDGLCKLSRNPVNQRWDAVLQGAHEISNFETLVPLVRANHRVDATLKWTGEKTLSFSLNSAEADLCMIELFDLPEGAVQSANAIILRENDEGFEAPLSTVSSGGQQGLRIVDVKPGDQVTISFD